MRRRTTEVLEKLHLDIDPASPLESHSIAVQQLVSIARAMEVDARVLILDEPTSSLDTREVDELFEVVERVRASGVAVVFITHFLDQVYRIANRITVLRNGRLVGEFLPAQLPRLELVSKMIGHELAVLDALEHGVQDTADTVAAPTFLRATGLGRKAGVAPLDLEMRVGEVVGMAGLLGSGRTETARLLFGADRADSGEVTIDGEPVRLRNPRVALANGIAYASENRRTEGLVGNLSVRANIILAMQSARGWARAIPRRQQAELADRYVKALDIRPPDPEAIVGDAVGRQPAEGAARPLAAHGTQAAAARRTDAGHRRRRQGRDPASRGRAGRRRHLGAVHLRRARRGAADVAPHRRDARAAQGGRDRQPGHHRERPDAPDRRRRRHGHRGRSSIVKAIVTHRLFWPLFILVGLLVATRLKSPIFFDVRVVNGNLYGSLITIVRRTAPTLLVALGMTLVIATRGIDLSVGAVAAIAGAAAATFIDSSAHPDAMVTVLIGVGIALLLSAAGGVWNGFLVTVLGIQPIVATLVLMTAGRGVAQLITDERIITPSSRPYEMIGGGYWLGLPFSIILAGVILLLTALLTRRTALGMLLESVGGNPEASRLAGVPARSITWTVYIVCAVFAGIAGLMITSDATAADPNSTGLFLEIDAILAVVIGGTSLAGGRFSLGGTVIGAFIIQTMTTMILILGIAPEITLVFKAGVVAAVCLIQSPEARALARRAVRRDPPYQAPPPSSRPTDGTSSTLGAEPLPDVTELVDVANSVQRESS